MNQLKIQDVYHIYSLCDKDIGKTLQYTNLSQSTIRKYIMIAESLDFELLYHLDDKTKKLSLDLACFLSKNFIIHKTQLQLFKKFTKNNKNNKIILQEHKTCLICCSDSPKIYFTECCNQNICLDCFTKSFKINLEDFSFKLVKCPFCNHIYDTKSLKNIVSFVKKYDKNIHYVEWINLLKIYDYTIHHIKREKKLLKILIKSLKGLEKVTDKQIYGICVKCLPDIKMNIIHRNNIKITSIERRCVNDQNQIVVLKPEMFHCQDCNKQEKIIVKKCPHCGVNTVKPDRCNYINNCVCGGAWCFVCRSRLPNNNYGHNHHYWIGPGSSAFDNACRVTVNSSSPNHVIHNCKCRSCRLRKGKPHPE